jgi:hypothetical protein
MDGDTGLAHNCPAACWRRRFLRLLQLAFLDSFGTTHSDLSWTRRPCTTSSGGSECAAPPEISSSDDLEDPERPSPDTTGLSEDAEPEETGSSRWLQAPIIGAGATVAHARCLSLTHTLISPRVCTWIYIKLV